MKGVPTYIKLSGLFALSIGMVILVFLLSDYQVHQNNAFTRQYPPHPITQVFSKDIRYNSYYIAGFDEERVYLGNSTAPLHVLGLNPTTRDTVHIALSIEGSPKNFESPRLAVLPPYFYLMQGTIPRIYRGSLEAWKADNWMKDVAYFYDALPINGNGLLIRTSMGQSVQTVLGKIQKRKSFEVELHPEILERQIDGVFDVDGAMVRSENDSLMAYVYYYRNQFLILDHNLNILQKRNTIDTVRLAKIEVTQIKGNEKSQMSKPPLQINKNGALYRNLMFLHSERLGRNEDRGMLQEASIIDVYNWEKGRYEFSFYLHHNNEGKLKGIAVYNNRLIALMGKKIRVYRLGDQFQNIVSAPKIYVQGQQN